MSFFKYGLSLGIFSILTACGSVPDVGPNEIDPRDASFMQESGYQILNTVERVQANLLNSAVSLNPTNFIIDTPAGGKYLVRLSYGCIKFDNDRIEAQFAEPYLDPIDTFRVYDINFSEAHSCQVRKIYQLQG